MANNQYAYVPAFKLVQESLHLDLQDLAPGQKVTISSRVFKELMAVCLQRGFFDERWYLETYPDVYSAIKEGRIASAIEHYTTTGYYEGRSPGPCYFDREWYENYYRDVNEAVKNGLITDSADHFYENGYGEGRAPCLEQLAAAERWKKLLSEE